MHLTTADAPLIHSQRRWSANSHGSLDWTPAQPDATPRAKDRPMRAEAEQEERQKERKRKKNGGEWKLRSPPVRHRSSRALGSMQSREQERIGREPNARNAEEHRRRWEVPRRGGQGARAFVRRPPTLSSPGWHGRAGSASLHAQDKDGVVSVSCGGNSNAGTGELSAPHAPARAAWRPTGRRRRSGAARGAERRGGRLGQAGGVGGASGRDTRETRPESSGVVALLFLLRRPGGAVRVGGGRRRQPRRAHARARGRLFASEQTERSRAPHRQWHPVRARGGRRSRLSAGRPSLPTAARNGNSTSTTTAASFHFRERTQPLHFAESSPKRQKRASALLLLLLPLPQAGSRIIIGHVM
ncbi:hypothetical protein BDA96_10G322600 [Sorghum bicolor]|uniref:Uncharacterized protein n=1 Tax=Sorghum bicolor TaxID=4558 RepID=A0A921U2X2_SORBI|nr:hypothetical protein BDA96_10G322600 [Sorghum bicolor]